MRRITGILLLLLFIALGLFAWNIDGGNKTLSPKEIATIAKGANFLNRGYNSNKITTSLKSMNLDLLGKVIQEKEFDEYLYPIEKNNDLRIFALNKATSYFSKELIKSYRLDIYPQNLVNDNLKLIFANHPLLLIIVKDMASKKSDELKAKSLYESNAFLKDGYLLEATRLLILAANCAIIQAELTQKLNKKIATYNKSCHQYANPDIANLTFGQVLFFL